MDDLGLGDVSPFDRPMTAGPNDRFVGRDDMGNKVYETVAGKRYVIRPATQEERDQRQPVLKKVKDWLSEGAPLPSWEQITDTMKAMPGAVYGSAQRSLSGDATLGELMGFAGASGAPGVASRVGTVLDPSVVSAMGATHKVPRYPKKEPKAPTPEQPETFNDDGLLLPETPDPRLEAFRIARDFVRPLNRQLTDGPDLAKLGDEITIDAFHELSPANLFYIVENSDKQGLATVLRDYAPTSWTAEKFDSRVNRMYDVAVEYVQSPAIQNLRELYTPFMNLSSEEWFDLDMGAASLDPWGDTPITGDGFTDRPTIQFRDPLDEILAEMEIPKNGITGAQLLKELQDNPTVRVAQLRSQGVFDRIDPAKRYDDPKARRNSREVDDLLLEGKYTVQAVPQNRYDSYQRQPVQDKELNYVEYAINADKEGPTFRANSQHYQDSTLAHVRLSERENASGNYVLIEELQSDLLQKGYAKPLADPHEALLEKVASQWQRDYPEWEGPLNKIKNITKEDIATVNKFMEGDDWSARLSGFANKLQYETRFDGMSQQDLDDILYRLSSEDPFGAAETISLPPIAKTEEAVRLGLETAIAHAAQNGIERVVLPPFHRIVEQRFTKGSAEYDKAMDPKSGFYQTYVGAVGKVLKKLNEDMGMDVEVREFDLSYAPSADARYITNFEEKFREMYLLDDNLTNAVIESEESFKKAYEAAQVAPHLRTSNQNFLARGFRFWREQFIWDIADRFTKQVLAGKTFEEAFAEINRLDAPTSDSALEINFSNAIKNGYDLTRPRFAEGGVVENQTPVPPGATPKEVADDVPIMASEGEYVIPANVVRFLGLDKIEKMVEQAKMKLAELDQKGRIGGDTGQEDDLPFSPEELQRTPVEEAMPHMATGGMVADPNMEVDPATGLPLWLLQMQGRGPGGTPVVTPTPTVTAPQVASPAVNQAVPMKRESDRDRDFQVNLTGTAQSVAKWTPAEFNKYARTRGGTGQALGSAAASMMVPFGGLATRMRGNYLERAVPRGFDTMLETGRDLQGNPLTADQITELRTSYDRVKSTPKPRTGAIGAIRGLAEDTGLVRRREPTAEREPRRFRDVFSGGSSSSPKASGDGLVSRPDKKKQSGGQKTSTNSTNGKTSSKKK